MHPACDSPQPGAHWYVVHIKPHKEIATAAVLQKHLGVLIYLPLIQKRSHGCPSASALFPGYLFVQTDLGTGKLSSINTSPGVLCLLAAGGKPQPIAEDVIEAIREHVDRLNAARERPQHLFQPGDSVRLTAGPLAGLEAVFLEWITPQERVRILLPFLGRLSEAEVKVGTLEPVASEQPPGRQRYTRGHGRRINLNDARMTS